MYCRKFLTISIKLKTRLVTTYILIAYILELKAINSTIVS